MHIHVRYTCICEIYGSCMQVDNELKPKIFYTYIPTCICHYFVIGHKWNLSASPNWKGKTQYIVIAFCNA